jgi:sortase A
VTGFVLRRRSGSVKEPDPAAADPPEDEPGSPPPAPPAGAAARSRPAPISPSAAAVVAALAGLAGLGVWFVLYALVLSGFQEGHSQHLMYSQLRYELAQATVPLGGTIAPGTPVAYISAASIGLGAVIVEGTSSADLAKGPGHLPSTPLPGQAGNSEIYGRSVMFGAPFGHVRSLRRREIITVTTGQGTFGYQVLDVRGPGDPLPSAAQIGQSSLTLVTSAGNGWRSGWAPDHVIYADATLVAGRIQPAPSGRPAAVPAVDDPLSGDTGVLVPLVLWLEALVLVSVAAAWAYTRWTGWQVWVVGAPAVLALLWVTTSTAILLLPNLA